MEILEVRSFSLSLVIPNLSRLALMAVGFKRIWECTKLRGFSMASWGITASWSKWWKWRRRNNVVQALGKSMGGQGTCYWKRMLIRSFNWIFIYGTIFIVCLLLNYWHRSILSSPHSLHKTQELYAIFFTYFLPFFILYNFHRFSKFSPSYAPLFYYSSVSSWNPRVTVSPLCPYKVCLFLLVLAIMNVWTHLPILLLC